MGWLWASPSPPKTPVAEDTQAAQTVTPTQSPQSSDVDPEIQKFMELFQSEKPKSEPKPTPSTSTTATSQPAQTATASSSAPASSSSWFSLKSSPASPSQTADQVPTTTDGEPLKLDPIGESLLPTEMSCRQAFDMAFHCQSVGGQWNAVYRSGGVRSCSENWEDFWFCMRVKGYSGAVKEEAIREHYRKKELAKYGPGQPSSEDIWKPRPMKVAPGSAFTATLEAPGVSDEEWQKMEMDRRRQVRQKLGYETGEKGAPAA